METKILNEKTLLDFGSIPCKLKQTILWEISVGNILRMPMSGDSFQGQASFPVVSDMDLCAHCSYAFWKGEIINNNRRPTASDDTGVPHLNETVERALV